MFPCRCLIIFLLIFNWIDAHAIDKTNTGFYYPTGTQNLGSYSDWLEEPPPNGNYFEDYYHLGKDIAATINSPVYAISDGEVYYISPNDWGDDNVGVFIKHTLIDGTEFLALYGHIQTNLNTSDNNKVFAGHQIGTVGPWDYGTHLHFGIHPSISIPDGNFGMYPLPVAPPYNGFVDPIDWIESQTPEKGAIFTLHRFLPDERVFIRAGDTYYHIENYSTLENYFDADMRIIDHPTGTPVPEENVHPYSIKDGMVLKEPTKTAVYLFKAGIFRKTIVPYEWFFDPVTFSFIAKKEEKLGFIKAFVDWDIFVAFGFNENDIRIFPTEFIDQFCLRGKNIISELSPLTIQLAEGGVYQIATDQKDVYITLAGGVDFLPDDLGTVPLLEGAPSTEPTPPPEITVSFPYPDYTYTLASGQDSVLIALNPTAVGGEDPIIWQCYDNEDIFSNGIRGRAPTIWYWFKEGRTQISCYAGYTSEIDGWHYGYEYLNVDVLPPSLPEKWEVPSTVYTHTVAADDNYIYIGGNEGAVQLGYMRRVRRDNPEDGYEKHTGWEFYKIMNTPWGMLAATWRGLRLSTDYGENWPDIFLGDEPVYDVEIYTDASLVLIGGLFNSFRGLWRVGEPLVTSNIYGGSVGPYNLMRLRKSSTNMDVLLGTTSMEGPSRINYHRFYNGVGGGAPNTSTGTDFSHAISSLFTTDGQTVLAAEKTTDQGEPEQGQNVWRSIDYGLNWNKSSDGLNTSDDIVGFFRAQEKPSAILAYSLRGNIYSTEDNGQSWQKEEDISRAMPIIQTDRDQFITTVLVDDENIVFGTTKGIKVTTHAELFSTSSEEPAPAPVILIDAETRTLNFGEVEVGDSKSLTCTVSNIGNATLTISQTSSTNSVFSFSATPINIDPGTSTEIAATFTPTIMGDQSTLLGLMHNASSSPDHITAVGKAIATLLPISAIVELPDVTTIYEETKSVPVRVTDTTDQGIWSASIYITIPTNRRVARVTGIETAGTIIEGWTTEQNIVAGTDGTDTLMVSAATDSNPLTGTGTLFNMILEVQNIRHPDATQFEVVRALFNDEDRTLESQGGSLTLVGTDGSVDISPANIESGATATISVIDADENRDDSASEQIRVQVISTECEDSEWVILTETQSGTFAGDIQTVYNQTCIAGNGQMELTAVDTMIVTYVDSLDSVGETVTRKDTTAALKTGTDGILRISRVVQARESSNGLRDTVRIELVDPDLNINENAVEQAVVILENKVNNEVEHITLNETEANTGIFRKRVPTGHGEVGADDDGIITITTEDSMIVSYEDILNSQGPKQTVTAKGYVVDLFGDLSGNGFVTAYDASLILRIRVGLIQPDRWDSLEADVDGMNEISTLDAVLVLRHDVHKIFRFPIQIGTDFDGGAVSSNSSHPFFKSIAGEYVIRFGEAMIQEDGALLVPVELSERKGIVAGSFDIAVGPSIGIEAAYTAEGYENYLIEHNVANGVLKLEFAGIEAAKEGPGPVVWIQARHAGEDEVWMRFSRALLNDQQVAIASGEVELTSAPVVPREFALLQNYPNPFNHGTVVPYHVADKSRVMIAVFNLAGQRVRILVDDMLAPGVYHATWDGTDDAGRPVTSGVYLYRVWAGDYSATKKMILLK